MNHACPSVSRPLPALGLLAVAALLTPGCHSPPALPPTPNLYVQGDRTVMETIPADRQTLDVEILYGTDRMPEDDEGERLTYYDERRSDSLAFGAVTMRLGDRGSWDELLADSLDPDGPTTEVTITAVNEMMRFPSSIEYPIWRDGALVPDPDVLAALDASNRAVRDELSRRLASCDRKEVFVYIHGVGNAFEDPMYRMAELWHFLGRPGVPIVYTWPAIKGGGPLRGYTYARESSEFTVFHMRQFLQAIASCPDVERIHLLAHSRGTGVTLSVLRDLRLIYLDDAAAARAEMKLANVILAAPDIDLQVAQQRVRPDRVPEIVDRITLYITPEDKALGIAEFLFSSLSRVGSVTSGDLSPQQIAALRDGRVGLDVIDVKVKKKGAHGHTYWIDNPSVLSDVILILRDNRSAGAEHGRPLLRAESGFWEVHDGYPNGGPHGAGDA